MTNWRRAGRVLWRMDGWQAAAMLVLVIMGVAFIYSASYRSPEEPISSLYRRQIFWAVLGFVLFIAMTLTDYRMLTRRAVWLYGLGLLLLLLVLFAGREVYGARRWLSFFGMQMQPSEFAKLGVILVLARYLGRPAREGISTRSVFTALGLLGVPAFLVVRQPDLGSAVIMAPVVLLMLFLAGASVRLLLSVCFLGLLVLPLVWRGLDVYQQERILVFFDPGRDPLGAGWNKAQSIIAVGSGGVWGKGYLQGTQNVLGYLPRTVAPTDFIYSVIAEETGFVGAVLVISLFAVLVLCCWRAAAAAPDMAGRLLAAGCGALLFFHAAINMAMTVGLAPITGLPLPLISYGGSFMLTTMTALGLVQSVYVRRLRR